MFQHTKAELVLFASSTLKLLNVECCYLKADLVNIICSNLFDTQTSASKPSSALTQPSPSKARQVFIATARETECSICFDEAPDIALMCCGGVLHFKCVQKWAASNQKDSSFSCPRCRASISSESHKPVVTAFVVPRRAQENSQQHVDLERMLAERTARVSELEHREQVLRSARERTEDQVRLLHRRLQLQEAEGRAEQQRLRDMMESMAAAHRAEKVSQASTNLLLFD